MRRSLKVLILMCFPKTRNVDGAINHRLDPNSEPPRRCTVACAWPKQDPPARTFESAAESDYKSF